MAESESYRWVMLVLGFLLTTSFAFGLNSLAPINHLIVADLGLTYSQVGGLLSAFSGPGLVMAIPLGLFAVRAGSKKGAILAYSFFLSGFILVIFSVDYLTLFLGRALSGIGALAIPILGGSVVSQWFKGKELGLALGLYNVSMPMGTLICLNTYGVIGEALGWRIPLIFTTLIGAVVFIIFLIGYRQAPTSNVAFDFSFGSLSRVFIAILPVGLTWMFFQATSGSYNNFATSYYLSLGHPIQIATLFTSAWMLGSLFLSPFVGKIIDRYNNAPHMVMVNGTCVGSALIFLPYLPQFTIVWLVLLSFGAALAPTCVLSLTTGQIDPHEMHLGYSIQRTFAAMGLIIGPPLIGYLHDISGLYTLSLNVMGLFMLAMIFTILPILRRRSKTK